MMGYDRISTLPDSLITQILLCLPTKDSIKTSVLSTRWRNLWLYVPGLELNSNDFDSCSKDAIKNFTDRFLELNRESRLQKFKIKYDECNVYLIGISEWIAEAINRGAQHLDVDTLGSPSPWNKDLMPLDIYKSKTLVSLKLVNVGMANPESVVSLPCLKIMHLENLMYSIDDPLIMEKLISGCPVLEDLTVCRAFDDNVPVLRVRSQTLKRLCVRSGPGKKSGGVEYAVEIDAPVLKYMTFADDQSDRVVAKNLSSLFMIDIDTKFNLELGTTLQIKKGIISDFLDGISNVKHMIISQRTLEVLLRLRSPITKLRNLFRLEAAFSSLLLHLLPHFLESCPNLKHLILNLVYFWKPKQLELVASVPRCLLSTLECVEIKNLVKGEVTGMKVVKYFLENSAVLKKLILCFKDSPITNQDSAFFKEFLTFTKRSRRCQIIFR